MDVTRPNAGCFLLPDQATVTLRDKKTLHMPFCEGNGLHIFSKALGTVFVYTFSLTCSPLSLITNNILFLAVHYYGKQNMSLKQMHE